MIVTGESKLICIGITSPTPYSSSIVVVDMFRATGAAVLIMIYSVSNPVEAGKVL